MADPVVDQEMALLREELQTLRTEQVSLRMQISLTRGLFILWVVVSVVLWIALLMVAVDG